MKNKFLWSFILISSLSFAQKTSNFRFGITASGNYSGVRGVHNPSQQKIGFNIGVVGIIPLDNSDQFYFQPQIEYVNAGEKGDNSTKYTNNYINIPLLVKAYFSEAESEFFGILGPRIGFLVNQKIVDPSEPRYYIDQLGKANSLDLALVGGLGYSYKRKHEVSLKIDVGLSDVYKGLDDSGVDPQAAAKNTQNIITLGYTYFFD